MATNLSAYTKPKLILVGGYLGAGKTTLLAGISHLLRQQFPVVGVITNDQTTGLVDTHILKLGSAIVAEISGSCFCCDFQGFAGAVNYLISEKKCAVVVAEPVGSCTDLSATILQPLKAMYADEVSLAPLTVLVDPQLLLSLLADLSEAEKGPAYIYLKQLEEADYIVVNKRDLLTIGESAEITKLLEDRFPEHPLMWMSAKENTGVKEWLEGILNDPCAGRRIASVDYDVYAHAEGMTGWYNGSFEIKSGQGSSVDWYAFHASLLELLHQGFKYEKIRIDHLKTFIKSGASHILGNITGNTEGIDIRGNSFGSLSARLVLNIRAETRHFIINELVEDVIYLFEQHGYQFQAISVKHLTPGRPQPQYRYDQAL